MRNGPQMRKRPSNVLDFNFDFSEHGELVAKLQFQSFRSSARECFDVRAAPHGPQVIPVLHTYVHLTERHVSRLPKRISTRAEIFLIFIASTFPPTTTVPWVSLSLRSMKRDLILTNEIT